MNRELITVIEQMGREKGIDKEILFEALESALLSASRKTLGASDNWRMHIDRKSGDLRVYCRKKVVTEVLDDKQEISLTEAKALITAGEAKSEGAAFTILAGRKPDLYEAYSKSLTGQD